MSDVALGIDLGTSNSVVTVVLEGEPIVIPDEDDNLVHPSVVHIGEDGDVSVGNEAVDYRVTDPEHTIYSVKRLMGRSYDDSDVKVMMGSYPYPIVEAEDGSPHIEMHGSTYSPEQVSSLILRHLKGLAENYMGREIGQAVITVPANFDEAQRRATMHAAELADLEVLRLVNEPTAAALAYGYGDERRERIAIYDFGGGTFDISLLELRDNVYEVVSTAGNSYLGGDDIDYRIVSMILNAFEKEHGYDLSGEETVQQRLKAVAKQIKHQLTQRESVTARVTEYVPGTVTELELDFTLDRETFVRRCGDIVDESLETCREAMEAVDVNPAESQHLVMVGGTTRIPFVQDKVRSFFNREPVLDIDPDQVVSIGAAIFGSSLTEQRSAPPSADEEGGDEPLLIDVTPHSLGVATVGGVMDIIIERNASLPLERERTFSTSRDNQTRVVLPVYAGNSRRIEDNRQLGRLVLDDLPARPREEVDIDVAFSVDTDGMLHVEAADAMTGTSQAARLSIMGDRDRGDLSEEERAALADTE
ncbi:MAG: Hsp70 family protein [Bradymonadaceae bacterium]